MAQIKVKISSKENMGNIHLPGMPEFIPLNVIRDEKTNEVKKSEGEAYIDEADLEKYQQLGEKYNFTVKKA